jgi:lysophospholipase L1-like esterase
MKIPLVRFAAFLLPLLAWAQTPALAPDLAAIPPPPNGAIDPKLPSLFIAGDSTAANNSGDLVGWGVPFKDYFDPARINVINRARAGRSTRTFISEGLWDQLLKDVKAGDIVLIQFGHNDGSPVNEDASVPQGKWRSRGTLPGLGEETQEIVNVLTNQPEVVHTFGWYVRRMIADVKARNATPVILSLTVRDIWRNGHVERGSGRFREWDRALAETAGVRFVDLTRLIADEYERRGEAAVKTLFGPDHTHTNAVGAELNAALVVAGLKGLRPPLLKDVFSARGAAIEADHIGWLNLPEPADPKLPSLFLIGDSTVRNGRGDGQGGQWGWGDYLGAHFDATKLNLVNRAVGGTTARTFQTIGYWERVQTLLKPGDFLVIQFGTNDGGAINDDSRARGSLPGTGEETQEIDNLLTKKHEVVHTNGWYLRKFVREARAAGVTPVLCSLVPRKIWKEGKIDRSGTSAVWARQVAEQEGIGFIDLNNLVAARYEQLGETKVNELFADEHTHTSLEGAKVNAGIVAAALRALPGDPLRAFAK